MEHKMFARKIVTPEMKNLMQQAVEIEERRDSVIKRLTKKLDELQCVVLEGVETVSGDLGGQAQ